MTLSTLKCLFLLVFLFSVETLSFANLIQLQVRDGAATYTCGVRRGTRRPGMLVIC